jgi:inner membrane protein
MIPVGVALALSLGGVGSILVSRAQSAGFRFGYAVIGSIAVIGAFAVGARAARARALEATEQQPDGRLLDVVITPCPGNPACFSVVTAQLAGDGYTARAGRISVLPGLLSAEQCRVQPTGLTLGLSAPPRSSSPGVYWEGQWRGSVSELQRLAGTQCRIAAWLRFARIPFWRASAAGYLVGDLRFDRDPELDFDELELEGGDGRCPPWLPPWSPPRAELMTDARAR